MLKQLGGWVNIQTNEAQPLIAIPAIKDAFQIIRALIPKNEVDEIVVAARDVMIGLLECLPIIMADSEHWTEKSPSERLELWLEGEVPPHRCVATDGNPLTRCLKHVHDEGGLCLVKHRCLSDHNGECLSPRLQGRAFCAQHICNSSFEVGVSSPCNSEKLAQGLFCMAHSCPCCVNDKRCIVNGTIGGKAPYACEKHQCGVYVQEKGGLHSTCPYPSVPPHKFCLIHCCVTCGGSGAVLNLVQAVGSRHCGDHKCLTDGCVNPKVGPFKYCADHICKLCVVEDIDPNPIDHRVPWSGLCSLHRCLVLDCENPKLLAPTESAAVSIVSMPYCLQHACRIGLMAGECCNLPVEDDYPRNVCSEHPLCTYISLSGTQCVNSAEPPFMNKCATHESFVEVAKTNSIKGDGQCCGVTQKNKRCKAKGVNSVTGGQFWCHIHTSQAPLDAPDEADVINRDDYMNSGDYAVEFEKRQRHLPHTDILRPFTDFRYGKQM